MTYLDTEAYDDETIEAFDDESLDDESLDDEAFSFADVLDPLGVRKLFTPKPRPPVPMTRISPGASGLGSAMLQTPKGSATIRFPEEVVPYREFRQVTQRLEGAINRNTSRINATERDIRGLNTRVASVIKDTHRAIAKSTKEQKVALAKLRKEQKAQAMNGLIMSILSQQQIRAQIEEHQHSGVTTGNQSTGKATLTGEDNSMLLILLPMMFSGMMGGSGDNNMMMPLMLMMMFAK